MCQLVHCKYYVEVKVLNYSNPSGRCRDCEVVRGKYWTATCCDDHEWGDVCGGNLLCDSYFTYCLRPFGSKERGCGSVQNWTSTVNENDGWVNFTEDTVLGLSNPLKLPGLMNEDTNGSMVLLLL